MRDQTKTDEWLTYALSNLTRARLGQTQKEILFSDLCFDCQQCVEKSLKALLIYFGKDFPKTHSISKLLELLESDFIINENLKKSGLLTKYAVENRYPNEDVFSIDNEDYQEALTLAEFVYNWVNEQIKMF